MPKKSKETPPQPKIVLETDVYPHLIHRIDHYLYKKWPDLFVDENFKEFKKDIETKHEEMRDKENRINARYQEWESKLDAKLKEIEALRIQLDLLRRKVSHLEEKKWYQFMAIPEMSEVPTHNE